MGSTIPAQGKRIRYILCESNDLLGGLLWRMMMKQISLFVMTALERYFSNDFASIFKNSHLIFIISQLLNKSSRPPPHRRKQGFIERIMCVVWLLALNPAGSLHKTCYTLYRNTRFIPRNERPGRCRLCQKHWKAFIGAGVKIYFPAHQNTQNWWRLIINHKNDTEGNGDCLFSQEGDPQQLLAAFRRQSGGGRRICWLVVGLVTKAGMINWILLWNLSVPQWTQVPAFRYYFAELDFVGRIYATSRVYCYQLLFAHIRSDQAGPSKWTIISRSECCKRLPLLDHKFCQWIYERQLYSWLQYWLIYIVIYIYIFFFNNRENDFISKHANWCPVRYSYFNSKCEV